MAGMKTVETIISANDNLFEISVYGAEPYGNYNRIMLSPVLCGEKSIDDIMIHDLHWYEQHNIRLFTGTDGKVINIDRKRRLIKTDSGREDRYDRLVIATGSNPFILPVSGHDSEGVMGFRDIYDVQRMLSYCEKSRDTLQSANQRVIVLGGGLLGLEAASGLCAQGMSVTVVHNSSHILNRQLDETAATLLQQELESRGIQFRLSAEIKQLIPDKNNHLRKAVFADTTDLECDLFVMAIGVRPNCALAASSGLYCERGIVVTDTLQTFDPSIYAVGECIQHRGQTFGLVAPLYEQAKVCANHLLSHGVGQYKTLPTATKLKVSGIQLCSSGDFNHPQGEYLIFQDDHSGVYKKLVLLNDQLIGFVLYGDTQDGGWYQSLLENKTLIGDVRHFMMFGKSYSTDNMGVAL